MFTTRQSRKGSALLNTLDHDFVQITPHRDTKGSALRELECILG